ncbi:MAG: hypothetical protein CSA22_09245 [Deltaproteobacteria bacterium]|nr:MAG: hypothetical protein CSA22_09245 [Deltaproteobacteria bacterium]
MVSRVLPLAVFSQFQIRIIDGLMFPEAAEAAGVKSAPTTLIDGAFRWTGMTDLSEILAILAERDIRQLGPGALINILQEGRAADLAGEMAHAGELLPAFPELLRHPKWPVRLGALVCLEYLADMAPGIVQALIPKLMSDLNASGTGSDIKGDLFQAIGLVGDRKVLPELLAMKGTLDEPELEEALEEALETLQDTHR